MKTNRKFSLGLLALIILCACARAPHEIEENALVPAVPLKPKDVRGSIVRVVSTSEVSGAGNGFFVAPDKIVTNIHLVAGANPVTAHVRGSGGTRSIRGVTAYDVKNNLVILKVSAEGVPLPLGNSDAVKTGNAISANGFRAGERNRVTQGTVLGVRDNDKWFSTTLDPDSDVSGSPIWNSKGEVVGIEVIAGEFGYAIPSNTLKVLLAESDTVEPFAQWQQRDVIRAYDYVEQAKRKLSDGDPNGMIGMLNEAITLNPRFAIAYTSRGAGQLSLGEFESENGNEVKAKRHYNAAIADFDKALQLNPDSTTVYKNRGLTKRLLADAEANTENVEAQRHYSAAVSDYTQAIKRMPNDAASYRDRGTARKNFGKFESKNGNAVEAQQHYNAAISDYTQTIKLKPDDTVAYYNRGLAKEALGRHKGARADFEKAETLKRRLATVRVERQDAGYGTGFFVARNKVATNIHVVAQPKPVLIRSYDEQTIWNVKGVTAFDVENDLVILEISGEGAPFPLADNDAVKIGDSVSIVGYPGRRYKVVEGTVRSIRNSDKWLQVNAEIAGGNSGSPVINTNGQVIGVVTGAEEPYGYIVTSNVIRRLLALSGPAEPLAEWQKRGFIRASAYAVQGQRKHKANHYVEAIADYDKAIKLNPKETNVYYNRGLAKFMLGDLEAAQGDIEEARKLYEAGVEDSTRVIKLIPEDANAYYNRGGGKFRLGQYNENQGDITKAQQYYQGAIDDWTQVIKLNSEYADPYHNRGAAKVNIGKLKADQGGIAEAQALYVSAIQDCTYAIQLNPEYADSYINRGFAKSSLGQLKADQGNVPEARKFYQEAIADLTKVIQLKPEGATAYSNRGWVRSEIGEFADEEGLEAKAQELYKAAIDDCTQAIQLDSENTNAYSNRAWAKYLLGKSKVAAENIEEARNLYEAAIIDADKSILLNPNNATVYHTRGVTRIALGDAEGAIADFDTALRINPKYAEIYYDRGRAKAVLGQTEAAKADLEKAKALNPKVEK